MQEGLNLLKIRELLKISQETLAKKIGYSREVVNKVEKGRIQPSKWFVEAVQQFVSEQAVHKISHDVNLMGRQYFREGFSYQESRRDAKMEQMPLQVPLVPMKAQAGYVKGFEQVDYLDTLQKYSLPPGVNPSGAVWRYFEIEGDSMEPTICSGDVVLATMVPQEDWTDIRNFHIYIIHTEDQLLLKRLFKKSEEEWIMISDNEEAYPQVAIKVESVKQLWLFRRHIRSKAPQPKDFKIYA